jgi:hypothetical protein
MQHRNDKNGPIRPSTSERPVLSGLPAAQLYWRRTLIPVLLTLGVLFTCLGTAPWLIDPEFPFSATNLVWAAVLLPIVGIVLLILAAVNMAYVKART